MLYFITLLCIVKFRVKFRGGLKGITTLNAMCKKKQNNEVHKTVHSGSKTGTCLYFRVCHTWRIIFFSMSGFTCTLSRCFFHTYPSLDQNNAFCDAFLLWLLVHSDSLTINEISAVWSWCNSSIYPMLFFQEFDNVPPCSFFVFTTQICKLKVGLLFS